MGASAGKVTYSDLLLAGYTEEDKRFELLDGDVYMVPGPNYRHQKTLQNLHLLLSRVVRRGKAELMVAPFDVVLSEVDYVQPDLVYIGPRSRVLTPRGVHGVPDLVIVVLSPTHQYRDLNLKRRRYQANRLPEVWYANPRLREVEVLQLKGKSYRSVGVFSGKQRIVSPVLGKLPFVTERIFEGVGEYD